MVICCSPHFLMGTLKAEVEMGSICRVSAWLLEVMTCFGHGIWKVMAWSVHGSDDLVCAWDFRAAWGRSLAWRPGEWESAFSAVNMSLCARPHMYSVFPQQAAALTMHETHVSFEIKTLHLPQWQRMEEHGNTKSIDSAFNIMQQC